MAKFGLNKKMIDEKNKLHEKLKTAHADLAEAVQKFNLDMEHIWSPVDSAANKYNAVIIEANEFQQTVAGDAQGAFDEKSEKWQESDSGVAAAELILAYEEELEEICIDRPDELEEPYSEAAEAFDSKPNTID